MKIRYLAILCTLFVNIAGFAQQKELAHFFLSSPGEYFQEYTDQQKHDLKDFIINSQFDSIIHQFMTALTTHQKHIFISYDTWNNFIALKKEIKSRIKELGITHPKKQLYIPKETKVPDKLKPQLENSIFIEKSELDAYKNKFVKLRWRYNGLVFFTDNQKHSTQILHPKFSQLITPLFVFNPQEWRMYDTHMGLYYLTPCESFNKSNWPVAIQKFIKIHPKEFCQDCHKAMPKHQVKYHVCTYQKAPNAIILPTRDVLTNEKFFVHCTWAENFKNLFNIQNISWAFYLTGHGGKLSQEFKANICALPPRYLKQILLTCNTIIPTHALYLNSCYAFPERLVSLFNKRHDGTIQPTDKLFNFDLIATTSSNTSSIEYNSVLKMAYYNAQKNQSIHSSIALVLEDYSSFGLAQKTAHLSKKSFMRDVQKSMYATKQKFPNTGQCLLPAQANTVIKS